jgi:hypothetical protein
MANAIYDMHIMLKRLVLEEFANLHRLGHAHMQQMTHVCYRQHRPDAYDCMS